MTASTLHTGAISHNSLQWHATDWRAVHRNVQRLQARIVKATQEERWGKVKALRHLLTYSFSGRAMAVKRVTENTGKRTSGVQIGVEILPIFDANERPIFSSHNLKCFLYNDFIKSSACRSLENFGRRLTAY